MYTEQLNVSVLSWRVNGTTLFENPRPNITADMTNNKNSLFLSVLRILALPQYNGTVAQCVALPTRDVSDNVTLLVQGWCSIAALMGIIYFENSVCNYHLAMKLLIVMAGFHTEECCHKNPPKRKENSMVHSCVI